MLLNYPQQPLSVYVRNQGSPEEGFLSAATGWGPFQDNNVHYTEDSCSEITALTMLTDNLQWPLNCQALSEQIWELTTAIEEFI